MDQRRIVETTLRVRYAETDAMGVVYHANYFVWFEVGRGDWFRAFGQDYGEWEALGYFLPVIGALYAPTIQGTHHARTHISAWMVVPLVILGALVLALGLYPGPWLDWVEGVGTYLLGS